MLEKLLSLLLHAKGGAVATVLVLGASGALVTATVENGMATVNITQPSQSSTGSQTTPTTTTANNTVTQQILALFNRTKAEDDPTAPATGNGCKDAAHAKNEQVKRVNDAFKTDHAAILALAKDAPKTEAARNLVKKADHKIKDIREAAVEKIHDLFESDACHDKDDEDKDEDKDDEDDDDATTAPATTGTSTGTTSTTTTTTVAISGTDAKAIADAAIAAMDKVVADLKTDLAKLPSAPTTTNTNNTNKGEKAKTENKSGKGDSNKGKGHSEGRSHEDDD